MRILPFILTSAITGGLIYILSTRAVLPAPLGSLLSPQEGVWQNAEPADADYSADLRFPQLKGKADVYLDDRLVPHIFAEVEQDAYFIQGYLHAKFRLWQMELQTHAAAGRASEIIGPAAVNHDREFRRLGMGYAAEQSLIEMEKDPLTKSACDAYTAGVNAYIQQLTPASLPLEYKLIGYKPEPWSNLKSALFLKYMSFDLAAREEDIEMTNARSFFDPAAFDLLYPRIQDSLDPIIPTDSSWAAPSVDVTVPATADSLYFRNRDVADVSRSQPDRNNGSNNWAVSGSKTKSGKPILCNDPHLGLNLPSLWYEIQISTPDFNAYGVSFPGAPGVIIGYNDSCAFGFTNGGRDVRDYFEIQFKDASRKEYWFNGAWQKTEFRVEKIQVKDSAMVTDSVAYTVFGPVMFDASFTGKRTTGKRAYAVRWKAHDPSNELKVFLLLDRAKNYADYLEATTYLNTPGQNCIFATKAGDIALRTEGEWPAKWKGQGDFVMPGIDSTFLWRGMIPSTETPSQHNPLRGFVSSANQRPVDTTYSYHVGRNHHFPLYRGIIINKLLREAQAVTPADMMALQVNNYDMFADHARKLFTGTIHEQDLSSSEMRYFDILRNWDGYNQVETTGSTVFEVAWKHFYDEVYLDEFKGAPQPVMYPIESSLVDGILRDSAYRFLDNVNTSEVETLAQITLAAFKKAAVELARIDSAGKLPWAKFKGTGVNHLAKLAPFSRLKLPVGGGTHCINATRDTHGPSWRMVIHLNDNTEAYGVYPGGQQGNPGSKYYDSFVDQWAAGKYYPLWLMKRDEAKDKRIKWKMTFQKA